MCWNRQQGPGKTMLGWKIPGDAWNKYVMGGKGDYLEGFNGHAFSVFLLARVCGFHNTSLYMPAWSAKADTPVLHCLHCSYVRFTPSARMAYVLRFRMPTQRFHLVASPISSERFVSVCAVCATANTLRHRVSRGGGWRASMDFSSSRPFFGLKWP